MKKILTICLLTALALIGVESVEASDDLGSRLLKGFVTETSPDVALMILDREPSPESSRVGHIYLDLKGAIIGGVRIDRVTVEAMDVVFTEPETWGTDSADVVSVLASNARTVIDEHDINDNLKSKEFGEDEHWNNLKLDFSPGKVYARGYYLADLKLFRLNILIEIDGTFKVVGGKEIWLDDYTLKVNRASVPDGLTERAIAKIQPILDLNKFMFPVKLSKVVLDEEKATINSVREPKTFKGIRYEYTRPDEKEEEVN